MDVIKRKYVKANPNQRLSKHFTLGELIKSSTATRLDIPNNPPDWAIRNLKRLSIRILEPVREAFGKPFTPNSGYRSHPLNAQIGGSEHSQHTKGEAVDFEIPGVTNLTLATWIRDNLEYDQIILEFYDPTEGPNSGWVHVSLTDDNRKQTLTINKNGTQIGFA